MSCYVEKVISIAMAEVGYKEKASNSNLDSKTANAGYNNYTKYARDLDALGNFYNGKKQGYAYCDIFVDWAFVQAYGVENAKRLLCQPAKSLGAGCQYSMEYYKNKGQLYTSPKIGDQIFFKSSSGEVYHTGLVISVDKSYVYTIEGNTSSASGVVDNGGCVCKKKYKLNNAAIAGYGRPKYDVSAQPVVKGGVCTMELNVLKKGSKGNAVRALQILLIGNGCSCGSSGADGDFGSATQYAVMKFQQRNKLDVDGVVGAKTWKKILGIA